MQPTKVFGKVFGMAKPYPLRKAKADMALKELDLGTVAKLAKVPYVTASEILNGYRNDPKRLTRLLEVIAKAPTPEEVHA